MAAKMEESSSLEEMASTTKGAAGVEVDQEGDVGNKQRIYEQTNIYSDEFKQQLMNFCHYYQIPFLDSNIPKTAKNAAKIYYRIL